MKKIAIHAKDDLRLEMAELPEPGEGQVRLRVAYVGICGSDLHYYFEGANGNFIVREPLVPGHELSATIDWDPAGHFMPGTAVTVHPATFGSYCEEIPDKRHLWPGGSYLGSASTMPHTQGAMSEYLIVNADMVRKLPDELTLRTATLAEPLGVALHAVHQAGDVRGNSVLVIGAGPIGLCQVAAAHACGAKSVAVSDMLEAPLQRATKLGASQTYQVGQDDIPADTFDVIFECSGSAPGVNAAWAAVRRGGRVVHVGMLPAGPQPLALATLIGKEPIITTSFRFNNEINEAVTMLAAHPEFAAIITHEMGVDEVVEAFNVARDSKVSGKVIVRMGGDQD